MARVRPPLQTAWPAVTLLASLLTGCMSCGVVGDQFAFSQDGRVLAFRDPAHGHLYVADSQGLRWVATSPLSFHLSRSGDRLMWFEDWGAPVPWPGTMAIHYVAERRTRRVKTPELTGVSLETRGESYFFDPAGAVVVQVKCYQQGNDPSARLVRLVKRFRWSPEDGWGDCAPPPAEWAPASRPPPTGQETHLVELGPDGWNARRTVWVRPDGSTLEIARQNDLMPLMLIYVAAFPVYAWQPAYWGSMISNPQGLARELKPVDNTTAQARLARLIAERKATQCEPPVSRKNP